MPPQAAPGPIQTAIAAPRAPEHTDLRVVASKNSTAKKYYFSWCSGASRIKAPNRIWFATATAAQGAGYTLAANCTE